MALRRVLVEGLAAEAPLLDQHFGRDTLMHDLVRKAGDKFRAEFAVAEHRHAAHTFHAAADGDIHVAGPDRLCRKMDRLLPGATESIDLDTRHADGKARLERGKASDVIG